MISVKTNLIMEMDNNNKDSLSIEESLTISENSFEPTEKQINQEDDEYRELSKQFDIISKNNVAKNIIKAFFIYLIDVKNNDLLSDFVTGSQKNYIGKALKIARNYQKNF